MPYAIDLFCGAGGFSEGILQSGFDIVFSSDKSPMVQETYTNRHKQLGLTDGIDTHFELADIRDVNADYIFDTINSLKYGTIFKPRSIDAMFGGPPCQGFSRLGKRDASDPRNMLFHEYLRLIKDIRPKYVVMENVTGIMDMQMLDFPSVADQKYSGQHLVPYILQNELTNLEYTVLDMKILNAADFGVPQQRKRAIFLAYRNDVQPVSYPTPTANLVTIYEALGDLYSDYQYSTDYSKKSVLGRTLQKDSQKAIQRTKITNMEISKHDPTVVERFSLYQEGENRKKALDRIKQDGIDLLKIAPDLFYETLFQINSEYNSNLIQYTLKKYTPSEKIDFSSRWLINTNKQLALISKLCQNQFQESSFKKVITALSRRLHLDYRVTLEFWETVKESLNQETSKTELQKRLLNGDIDAELANALFTKKGIRTRLDSNNISPTVVTLPDDYIHPYFNRILTVREMARLQSFDDSFEFLGKRTTGGDKRAIETPQYTQVGNAVPPLLARAVAKEVAIAIEEN
ncbi:DNA cytosine methyltransferase [Listeria monocytogenes]